MEKTTIIIADTQYLIRAGLRCVLQQQDSLEIVGEVTNQSELFKMVEEMEPDIVILDYNQPPAFTVDAVPIIKSLSSQTQILIISADDDKKNIFSSIENGAVSYLTKKCGESEILDAIRATSKNEKFFCNKVLDFILEKSFKKDNDLKTNPLTPREIEIVQLVVTGKIAKEIASELNLSTHTIYTHRKNIMKKLKINSNSELVLYALQEGLVE